MLKIRDAIRMLEEDGWQLVKTKGSHRQYKHPVKKGKVTIAVHKMSDDLPPGTENSIKKQAGLK